MALFGGGANGSGWFNTADIYNATSSTWTVATLSQARNQLAATTVGNLALFAGGYNGVASDRVDIFNYLTNTWTQASLSIARSGTTASAVGDWLYLVVDMTELVLDLVILQSLIFLIPHPILGV